MSWLWNSDQEYTDHRPGQGRVAPRFKAADPFTDDALLTLACMSDGVLLMRLEEHGPQKQSELAKSLDTEPYSLSRLLTKLERSRYVTRTREATDKIVSLKKQE